MVGALGDMKTSDVLIVFGVVIVPGGLAVFFGVLAAFDYAHPGAFFDPMLGLLGSAICLVVAVGAGLITTGIRLRRRASTPEPSSPAMRR
jgi:hypothetical protein